MGKIPYQPWALERRNRMVDEYISPLAACAPPGVPRQVYAPGGTQVPGYVVFVLEYRSPLQDVPIERNPVQSARNRRHWRMSNSSFDTQPVSVSSARWSQARRIRPVIATLDSAYKLLFVGHYENGVRMVSRG